MGKVDRFFSVLAMLVGLALIILSIIDYSTDQSIKRTGAKAVATVVDTIVVYKNPKSKSFDSFRDKSVWGVYRFKAANGATYEVQATTSGAHLGKQTTIYYDPVNPQQNYYLDSDAYGFYLGLGIGCIILFVGALFYQTTRAKKH
jgi:hypothetical protein